MPGVCAAEPKMSYASGIVIDNLPQDLTGKTVLDMGSGCGVLSIAAAKRGAKVIACDNEPMAVSLTEMNLKRNPDIENRVNVHLSNLFEGVINAHPSQRYDRIMANLWFATAAEGRDETRDKALKCYEKFLENACDMLTEDGVACLTSSAICDIEATENVFRKHGIEPKPITVRKTHFGGKVSLDWHLYCFDKEGKAASFKSYPTLLVG